MRHVLVLLALAAVSCRVPGKHIRTGPELPPREKFCDIRTYRAGEHPAKATVLGTVEAEASDEETLRNRLQSHACFLGADALVQVKTEKFTITKDVRGDDGEWHPTPVGTGVKGTGTAVLLADATPVPDKGPPAQKPPGPPAYRVPTPRPPPPPPSVPGTPLDMGEDLLRETPDAGTPDAGTPDAGLVAGMPDAGTPDAGTPIAGTPDAGRPDAGTPDAGRADAGTRRPDAGTTPDAGVDEFVLPPLDLP